MWIEPYIIAAALKAIEEIRARGIVSANGVAREFTATPSADADPQLDLGSPPKCGGCSWPDSDVGGEIAPRLTPSDTVCWLTPARRENAAIARPWRRPKGRRHLPLSQRNQHRRVRASPRRRIQRLPTRRSTSACPGMSRYRPKTSSYRDRLSPIHTPWRAEAHKTKKGCPL